MISLVKILLEDALLITGKKAGEDTLDILTSFFMFPSTRIIAVENGSIYTDNTIRIVSRPNESDYAIIHEKMFNEYYSEIDKTYQSLIIHNAEDIISLSASNNIPLSRITLDYENLSDLNAKYQEKIALIYQEIEPVIEFLEDKISDLFEPYTEIDYHNTVRKFLLNELNKE